AIMRRTHGAADKFGGRVSSYQSRIWRCVLTACVALTAIASTTTTSLADEDGVSFWIPGFFGSLGAAPLQPGWSMTSILYNTNVSASGNAAIAREIRIGDLPRGTINISGNANVHADATIGFVLPSYTFATPFLGGQATAILLAGYGNNDTSLNANVTATANIGGMTVGPFSTSISRHQDTTGFTDLIPIFIDRWNAGVNNYMAYITGDIPVGLYSSSNLANIGIGHGA